MEFVKGSRGIYKPIRVLFDAPIYARALQICWHMPSYKTQIALVTELLRLQQKHQLPSEVTADDISELLVEETKSTLRLRLWEFELEGFDESDVKPLLNLLWDVNTSMKMRDIDFEARRLLSSPKDVPPEFQHPRILSQAQEYARTLTEQQQKAPSSKLLRPKEVVMEVVPKVLQAFWLPRSNTSFNMPSKLLSKMAIGVTKAVLDRVSTALSSMLRQVPFSRSMRKHMVLSILEKVHQGFTKDVLAKKLKCFVPELLSTIANVAATQISALFQSDTHTEVSVSSPEKEHIQPADVVDDGAQDKSSPAEDEEPGLEEDTVPLRDTVPAVITPPPAPLIYSVEPPAHSAIQHDSNWSVDEAEEQTHLEPDFAAASAPSADQTPPDEASANTGLEETEEQPAQSADTDSAVVDDYAEDKSSPAEDEEPGLEEDTVPLRDTVPAVITPPPAPLIYSVEPPAHSAIQNGLNSCEDETVQQSAHSPEPDSAVVLCTPPPLSRPASVQDGEDSCEEPIREPDSAVVSAPAARLSPVISTEQRDLTSSQHEVKTEAGIKGLFHRFRRTLYSWFLSEDAD